MRIHDALNEALLLIGDLQQTAESAGKGDEVAVWRYLREHVLFAIKTGQVYVFEDYLAGLDPARTSYASTAFNACADALSQQGMTLLLRALDEMTEPAQKRHVLVAIDLLNFIATSGQHEAFERYLKEYYEDPPPAIAFFGTLEEAEAWLSNLAEPPSGGNVLIGDEYYEVWYSREEGIRRLLRDNVTEMFLADFESEHLPPVAASFNAREEAMAWLASHPASPTTLVAIAGEHYHAVYHKKFDRHTLHSLSYLREWREKRKAELEQQENEGAEPSDA